MHYSIRDGALTLSIDSNMYDEAVIYKCFYWYTDDFDITIALDNSSDTFSVSLCPKTEGQSLMEILPRIQRDLIDFKLRNIVSKETRAVRELIIAKAFAYYDVDMAPETAIADPVGFLPTDVV